MQIHRRDPSELGIDLAALAPFASAMGPLAIVDLETTGLPDDPAAELLELGVVLLDAGSSEVSTLDTLVRPSQPLPLLIQRLTGLTDADVADAPAAAEVAGLFGSAMNRKRGSFAKKRTLPLKNDNSL